MHVERSRALHGARRDDYVAGRGAANDGRSFGDAAHLPQPGNFLRTPQPDEERFGEDNIYFTLIVIFQYRTVITFKQVQVSM